MKEGFGFIEPLLVKKGTTLSKRVKVILATVKGDIHDIGKNIVSLMLKNYNFDVVDLGKDIASETIVETAIKENAQIVGLSALMTTTMVEMKSVIKLLREKNSDIKVMVGGAVITEEYAKEIEADAFAKDSISAVKVAKDLSGIGE